jgi:hypothetical protein
MKQMMIKSICKNSLAKTKKINKEKRKKPTERSRFKAYADKNSPLRSTYIIFRQEHPKK